MTNKIKSCKTEFINKREYEMVIDSKNVKLTQVRDQRGTIVDMAITDVDTGKQLNSLDIGEAALELLAAENA
jgi:hypothetical protein